MCSLPTTAMPRINMAQVRMEVLPSVAITFADEAFLAGRVGKLA